MATNEIQQQLLRDMGYGGAFGAGGAQAWLNEDPSRRSMFDQRVVARDQGYTGPFGGGAYQNWQNGGNTYDQGGVAPVGVVEPFNAYQTQGLQQLATPFNSEYAPIAKQTYKDAVSYSAAPQQTTAMAIPAIQSGQQAFTDADFSAGLSRYSNPYQQQVIDRSISRINEQGDAVRNRLMAKMPGSRSFGTSSDAIQNSELDKNLLNQVGDTAASLNYAGSNNAASQATNQFNQDRARDFSAAGAYGATAGTQLNNVSSLASLANLGLQGNEERATNNERNINNMFTAGSVIQNQNQKLLDATQGDYQQMQGFDEAQLQDLAKFLSQFTSSEETGAQAASPTALGKLGGLGLTALGSYRG